MLLKCVVFPDSGKIAKKKKIGGTETAKAKKSAKSSKVAEPQLLPLIQSLVKNTDSQSVVNPSSNRENHSGRNQSEPFVNDSEESSLDSLPGLGLKSRVLEKMVKLSSVIDSERALDPRQSSQELISSQSSVGSDRSYKVPKKTNKSSASAIKSLTGDINSNFSVPKIVQRTDSQDTNSQESSQNSIQSLSSVNSVGFIQSLPKPDFVLRPGEFDIVLCVDNAEYYGA